jgi:microcystin degradation protein MlrC
MWDGREIMQAALISPEEAVTQAKARLGEICEKNVVGKGKGTIIFSDAADATTSGASGNSNQLLRCLVEAGYTGSVLFPIVDPDAVAAAKLLGEGSCGKHAFESTRLLYASNARPFYILMLRCVQVRFHSVGLIRATHRLSLR